MPPRVASLGYDALALAAVLEQRGAAAGAFLPYTPEAITQTVGFAGIDGIFRFLPSGHVQRGLAVLEIQRSGFVLRDPAPTRSEEHTSELQSLMRISYAVFCLKKKTINNKSKGNMTT